MPQGHKLIYSSTGKENLTNLAIEAAWKTLEMADVLPGDVYLILMCSSTGDDRFGDASTDRGSCILFGDAAGAVLVQACDIGEDGLFGFDLYSNGDGKRHLIFAFKENETNYASNENHSVTSFPPKYSSYSYLQMNDKEIFKFSVRVVLQLIEGALEKASLAGFNNFDWLLLHQ
ncbi:hypothetical protein T459_25675, partial [Capsicum annuum]